MLVDATGLYPVPITVIHHSSAGKNNQQTKIVKPCTCIRQPAKTAGRRETLDNGLDTCGAIPVQKSRKIRI